MLSPELVFVEKSTVRTLKNKKRPNYQILEEVVFLSKVVFSVFRPVLLIVVSLRFLESTLGRTVIVSSVGVGEVCIL